MSRCCLWGKQSHIITWLQQDLLRVHSFSVSKQALIGAQWWFRRTTYPLAIIFHDLLSFFFYILLFSPCSFSYAWSSSEGLPVLHWPMLPDHHLGSCPNPASWVLQIEPGWGRRQNQWEILQQSNLLLWCFHPRISVLTPVSGSSKDRIMHLHVWSSQGLGWTYRSWWWLRQCEWYLQSGICGRRDVMYWIIISRVPSSCLSTFQRRDHYRKDLQLHRAGH